MRAHVINALANFIRSESAPTAVEYAVMLALILLVVYAAVTTLGQNVAALFQSVDIP